MAPVVFVVFVELLAVVPRNDDHGVVGKSAFVEGCKYLSYKLVGLVASVAVKIPEGGGVEVIVQFGVVGVWPAGLEGTGTMGVEFKAVWSVVEEEGEEGRVCCLLDEVLCYLCVPFIYGGSRCFDADVFFTGKKYSAKGWIELGGTRIVAESDAFLTADVEDDRCNMVCFCHVPVVGRNGEDEAEDAATGTVAATEVVFVPLVLKGIAVSVWHTFGGEGTGIPRVDEDEQNVVAGRIAVERL